MSKVALLQFNSGPVVEDNLRRIETYLHKAKDSGTQLVVLPENFAQMRSAQQGLHTEVAGQGLVQNWLSDQAKQTGLWLLAGSVPIALGDGLDRDVKPYSRSLLYDENGAQVAHYDKIHLYDVNVPDGKVYRESDEFSPGNADESNIVIVDTPIGRLGLSICYDLRFPEIYRALTDKGAQVIAVPAAFTQETGRVHWEPLLKARAIENTVYVLASGQVGVHASGRATWGHTMCIDPWGEVLAQNDSDQGLVFSQIDLIKLDRLKRNFPSFSHRRLG